MSGLFCLHIILSHFFTLCMIVINRGEGNTFVLTLNESTSLSSPYFLLVLYAKNERAVKKFFITDTSTSTEYNKFSLTEGTDQTIERGDYTYKVYEKDSNANTDIPAEAFLLETGILRSVGSSRTSSTYTRTSTSNIHDNE